MPPTRRILALTAILIAGGFLVHRLAGSGDSRTPQVTSETGATERSATRTADPVEAGASAIGAPALLAIEETPTSDRAPAGLDASTAVELRVEDDDEALIGLVVEAGGMPIPGAQVWTDRAAGPVRTDGSGRFTLAGLPPGECVVEAAYENRHARARVRITPREVPEELVLELPRNGRIEGSVFDAEGLPSIGAEAMALTPAGFATNSRYETKADEAGRFVFADVPPGHYLVACKCPPPTGADSEDMFAGILTANVVVEQGATSEVELRPAPSTPVEVFGRATFATGEPIPGFLVLRDRARFGEGTHMVNTDEAGAYHVVLESPGDWLFAFGGFFVTRLQPIAVHVPPVERFQHDFTLPLLELSGVIQDPRGKAVSECEIVVAPVADMETFGFPGEESSYRSDEDGSFRIPVLREGEYELFVTPGPESPGLAVGHARIRAEIGPEGEPVVIVLSSAVSREGRTLDENQRPVVGAGLAIYSPSGKAVHPSPLATSDARGRFSLEKLPPGELCVIACTPDLASLEAHPIGARAGNLEIILSPAAWLVVEVKQGEGPLCTSRVEVRDSKGFDRAAVRAPDANLRFLLEGLDFSRHWIGPLPAGQYQVSVKLSDSRAEQRSITTDGRTETRLSIAFE